MSYLVSNICFTFRNGPWRNRPSYLKNVGQQVRNYLINALRKSAYLITSHMNLMTSPRLKDYEVYLPNHTLIGKLKFYTWTLYKYVLFTIYWWVDFYYIVNLLLSPSDLSIVSKIGLNPPSIFHCLSRRIS